MDNNPALKIAPLGLTVGDGDGQGDGTETKELVVTCPKCREGILIVKDQELENNVEYFDRYMKCNNCAKWNVIRIKNFDNSKSL